MFAAAGTKAVQVDWRLACIETKNNRADQKVRGIANRLIWHVMWISDWGSM